ncbi:hypothetical protein ACV2ZF_30015, partial [Escherichia coli]
LRLPGLRLRAEEQKRNEDYTTIPRTVGRVSAAPPDKNGTAGSPDKALCAAIRETKNKKGRGA